MLSYEERRVYHILRRRSAAIANIFIDLLTGMLGFLFLAGSALLGTCVTRRALRGLLTLAEQILWGTTVGWTLSTTIVYLLARGQGHLSRFSIVSFTVFAWVIAAFLLWPRLRSVRRADLGAMWRREYSGLALVIIVFAPIYARLFFTQMFAPGQGGVYSGGGAWYDLSFHSALATSFAYGNNFPPVYPLLPPAPLWYPFLPDFQLAVLMNGGLSLRAALLTSSLVLALVTTGLFYFFALRIARGRKSAALATILFLLNGGLGFAYFISDWRRSGKSFFEFWRTLSVDYAVYPDRGLYWTNLVDLFPGQRSILFGLPITFLIFTIFVIVWQRRQDELQGANSEEALAGARMSLPEIPTARLMLIGGALAGLLPFFHTHSYIAVGIVSVVLFLLAPRRDWLFFWIPAVMLPLPQIWLLFQRAAAGSVVRWRIGWMGQAESFLPWYLLRDFGLPLLLAIPGWFFAPKPWRKFYLAFVAVFVLALSINVSPNAFDNGKLIYYWHGLNSVLVAAWLIRIAKRSWQRVLAGTIAFLCTATGIIALQYENHNWSRVFTSDEIAAADFVRQNTGPRALFVTAPVYNQPVVCLAGRAGMLGNSMWLSSHGYEFRERESDVRRIYAGTRDARDLLRYYEVDYIYLSNEEKSLLNANESFLQNNFVVVYRNSVVTIYDARRSPNDAQLPLQTRNGALHQPPPRELAALVERDPYALLAQFPRSSFFVYRLFKAAYGPMPRRKDFMSAMTEVGRGVFIGKPGWQEQLDSNKKLLLGVLVESGGFKQFYDVKSNAEFLDILLTNAGVNWSKSKRATLVNQLDARTESRASALLSVIEDRAFFNADYNNAYVLMHFFGYLGRNPDDPPDGDLRGLEFWRNVLDRSDDYAVISRAFIESDEYRKRTPAP